MSGCRVFIGRLSPHARERDVEKFFKGYGRIREINLKNGFGFVVSVADCFFWIMGSYMSYFFVVTTNNLWFCLLRNLMTTEMQMTLCTSWMERNCAVKGKDLILDGSFCSESLTLTLSLSLNGGCNWNWVQLTTITTGYSDAKLFLFSVTPQTLKLTLV